MARGVHGSYVSHVKRTSVWADDQRIRGIRHWDRLCNGIGLTVYDREDTAARTRACHIDGFTVRTYHNRRRVNIKSKLNGRYELVDGDPGIRAQVRTG